MAFIIKLDMKMEFSGYILENDKFNWPTIQEEE